MALFKSLDLYNILQIVVQILSAAISSFLLFTTWKIYKRENTINNENFLFQKKYESHKLLFELAVEYLDLAEDAQSKLTVLQKSNSESLKNDFNATVDKFDALEDKLQLELYKHTLVLPEEILNEYVSFVADQPPWENLEDVKKWNDIVEHLTKALDKIHLLTTKDLHIEELSSKIMSRIGQMNKKNKTKL